MQSFQILIEVGEEDLDSLNHVNNVRYVQWVQNVAEQHWQTTATSSILSSFFWVLLEHQITYKNPAFLGDKIILRTYVPSSTAATCVRMVEILNATTSTVLAISKTTWCLVDQENMKPTRITDEIRVLFS